ncbi:MAG: N-acyl-D-glucosamine 2-epimerase [Chloroflexi bacterium]|nr:MAG: N-acyl-D-glucosamine 2-epimerase [Chloroflexota bacterium]
MILKETLRSFSAEADQEVRHNILPFWLKLIDAAHDGFYGEVSFSGEVQPRANKGGILCARLAWTFSHAYQVFRDPAYLEAARHAYQFLTGPLWDAEHGGTFWSVDYAGRPLDTRKLILAQSFTIYGLAEYFQATRDPEALVKAIDLFDRIEAHSRDARFGGYFDAFDRRWQRTEPAPGAAKAMDPHLRLMMAYTNLLRAWDSPVLKLRLKDLVEIFLERMIDPQTNHLIPYLSEDWRPGSVEFSYGHDIELVWLLPDAAALLGDAPGDTALWERVVPVMLRMAEGVYRSGIDKDGAIFDKGGPGGLLCEDKIWWPQAESVVGFLSAYQVSGEEKYFHAALKNWEWIQSYLVDREHGEWRAQLTRDRKPVAGRSLVDFWKCPYHNSRCCFQVQERIEKVIEFL